ncbi:N-acetylneuraminate synthase [Lentilitoribacter sp. EG35]|uniref:N-acetylneuraminate synthase n=1 Tax=Lentilitoribacter sp. EG35 TaxID=3234192 RepID=UPI00345F600E
MADCNKTLIIAEAGVNHNGDIDLARKLIDEAAASGADIVKFQTFQARNIASRNAAKADYQKQNTRLEETQFEMLQRLELAQQHHSKLLQHCEERNIRFLSSGFDISDLEFLIALGIDRIKIPSGEITNLPYLRFAGNSGLPILLSTGMASLNEVEDAIKVLLNAGSHLSKITVLHCNTEYPTPFGDVNLKAMNTMAKTFGVKIGYSDHTLGIEVATAAVALGATVIEKHFTLDRNMSGPDHAASLEPKELKAMVIAIRNIEIALGDGIKQVSESEKKNIKIARRSLFANTEIKKGDMFTPKNLVAKRPGTGISPMQWDDVIGTKAHRDYLEDEMIVQ